MNNEEMFMTILNRMDSMESGLNDRMDELESSLNGRMDNLESSLNGRMDNLESSLNGRMDKLDGRMDELENRTDKLESEMKLEFFAVRTEMDEVYKMSKKQFDELDSKLDRLMFTKDVEGYDKVNIRVEMLERVGSVK